MIRGNIWRVKFRPNSLPMDELHLNENCVTGDDVIQIGCKNEFNFSAL